MREERRELRLRLVYGVTLLCLLSAQIIAVTSFMFLAGFRLIEIDRWVLTTFVGGTLGEVSGLAFVVVRYLFPISGGHRQPMTTLDLRIAFNALSDVVVNRPPPLREFDQIYMKISDMLLQAEHLSRWLDKKSVVCLGDGDAIGLTLVHLKEQHIFERGPSHIHVLDFDERVVNSINTFANAFQLSTEISAELYNVADPLPKAHLASFDAFYTNPPFGASNGGPSVEAFLAERRRGNSRQWSRLHRCRR